MSTRPAGPKGGTVLGTLRDVVGFYLVFTLTSTALAKLARFSFLIADVSAGLRVPRRLAASVVSLTCLTELWLAAWLAMAVRPNLVGGLTAALFLAFGGYRALVAIKIGRASCNCAGEPSVESTATLSSLLGVVTANVLLAGVALGWAYVAVGNTEGGWTWLPSLGMTVPLAALVAGRFRQLLQRRALNRSRHRGPDQQGPGLRPDRVLDALGQDDGVSTSPL